jgi:serine/threonine protein phosphatase PrpC
MRIAADLGELTAKEPAGAPPEGELPRRPGFAVWSQRDPRSVSAVSVWSERRPGLGEDAEPTFMHDFASGRGLLGVYDGLGGAGAHQVGTTGDGRNLNHAFVASRLASLTAQRWFVDRVRNVDFGDGRNDLRDRFADVLRQARPPGRLKLAGTLRRDLPTTVALLEYHATRAGIDVAAYWAGDSRCYVLTPEDGLQQLSQDDSEVRDPLELLIADQPMTNVVCASAAFDIHEERIDRIKRPCVLVCATDGCFGYVATPALFEYEILNQLMVATDENQFGHGLVHRIAEYTSDDASLALVALGFRSFNALRHEFAKRHEELRDKHLTPIDNVRSRDELVEERRRSWELYRKKYMFHIDARSRSSR